MAAASTIRAGYEYQGQKCSACSRLYVPESLWPALKKQMTDIARQIKVGDVCLFFFCKFLMLFNCLHFVFFIHQFNELLVSNSLGS